MSTSYAQKQSPAQNKDAPSGASVLDSSSQSEALQRKADMANNAAQREEAPRLNNTGMPDNLKSGIESLSGFSMDDVRVHYNSSKPATVQALAYAQGTDIHVASGQEKHLPHEAWHVAQQMAGRVSPTTNINGMPVNDNAALEHEADVMGEKAVTQRKPKEYSIQQSSRHSNIVQYVSYSKFSPNKEIDPNVIGENKNGIRELEEKDKRPDDVPLCQDYRLAIHKLMNAINILEISSEPGNNLIQEYLKNEKNNVLAFQKDAKHYAVDFKKAMRNLESDATVETIQNIYKKNMDTLTTKINQDFQKLQIFFNKCLPDVEFMLSDTENGNTILKDLGTDIWRDNWLTIKESIDNAIDSIWPRYQPQIKQAAFDNYKKTADAFQIPFNEDKDEWKQKEEWKLSYIGSLAKGYKGPPKQNTRFFSSSFDVDANLDAPLLADYLILKDGNIDRGQLIPTPETKVPLMDQEIHETIIDNLMETLDKNEEDIKEILSEPFETRINAIDKTRYASFHSIEESEREQRVRDELTNLRHSRPDCMPVFLAIKGIEPYLNPERNALSTETHLGPVILRKIENKIEKIKQGHSLTQNEKRALKKTKKK